MNGPHCPRASDRQSPQTYQPLRGHMVRLLPSSDDLLGRHPIVLTTRDEDLLVALHEHGFLTAEQLTLAYFPPPAGSRRSHCSACYERLRELWLWDYTDRVQRPVSPRIGGSRPLLHALGPRGVDVVAARLGEGAAPVRRRRLDRLDDAFVEHDLRTADVWANLAAHVRATRLRGWRWTGERALRARAERVADPATGERIAVLPDGAAELVYPDGRRQVLFVEIDNGTHTLDAVARKVRGLELYHARGAYRRRWDAPTFEVIALSPSAERMANVWAAARAVVPAHRRADYSFATFAVLDPAAFAGHDWLTLEGTRAGLLYRDAYVHETAPGVEAAPHTRTPRTPSGAEAA